MGICNWISIAYGNGGGKSGHASDMRLTRLSRKGKQREYADRKNEQEKNCI